MEPRQIVFAVFPAFPILDLTGPHEVFAQTNRWGGEYRLDTVAAGRARRVTSVCSGSFVLARAGLLDGRRAVTHWASCDLFARLYPAVTVERDPIFVRDGHVWTSADVTAGINLTIARHLIMFVQRPGRTDPVHQPTPRP